MTAEKSFESAKLFLLHETFLNLFTGRWLFGILTSKLMLPHAFIQLIENNENH